MIEFKNNLLKKKNIVIVGGGLPGIFSALYNSIIYPEHEIHLIESGYKLGGLYNSFNDKEAGIFDKGMHVIYETCNEEIDFLIRSCLQENDWHYLEGNYKDIAGVYFKGRLETKTPYLNIDQVSKDKLNKCLSDFFLALEYEAPSFKECKNAREFLEKRFGYSLTEELFEPAVQKLWRTHTSKLNATATRIVLMDRISIFSEKATKDLMKSNHLRSRIAFPDQMKLDLSFRSNQRGLYPKSFGLYKLIDKMTSKLLTAGVKIHTSSNLKAINVKDNRLLNIEFESTKGNIKIDSLKFLHWSISPLPLLKLLNINCEKDNLDPPINQRYVFLLLKEPPKMDDLYYFYSLEPGTKTYRVTSYSAYCPDAIRNKNHKYPDTVPICIEMHYASEIPSEKIVFADCIEEILKFGIISDPDQIVFSKIEKAGGVPLLTTKNCNFLSRARDSIFNLNINNLLLAGQSPEKGIFFLHDVLSSVYSTLLEFKKKYN